MESSCMMLVLSFVERYMAEHHTDIIPSTYLCDI